MNEANYVAFIPNTQYLVTVGVDPVLGERLKIVITELWELGSLTLGNSPYTKASNVHLRAMDASIITPITANSFNRMTYLNTFTDILFLLMNDLEQATLDKAAGK